MNFECDRNRNPIFNSVFLHKVYHFKFAYISGVISRRSDTLARISVKRQTVFMSMGSLFYQSGCFSVYLKTGSEQIVIRDRDGPLNFFLLI